MRTPPSPTGGTLFATLSSVRPGHLPLLPHPSRVTFLYEGADTFLSVRGLHQFFQINLLRPREALVEVHRVPSVDSLLGYRQCSRTQTEQLLHGILNGGHQIFIRHSVIG